MRLNKPLQLRDPRLKHYRTLPAQKTEPPKTQIIVQEFDDMMLIATSSLFRSEKNTLTMRNTWFPDRRKNRCFKQIESNSIRCIIKNNFDSKVSFGNTLIRALIKERNINNRCSCCMIRTACCVRCSVCGIDKT